MVLFWFREGRQLSRVLIKPAVIDWRSTAFSYRDRRLTSRTMNSSGSGLPKCEHPRPAAAPHGGTHARPATAPQRATLGEPGTHGDAPRGPAGVTTRTRGSAPLGTSACLPGPSLRDAPSHVVCTFWLMPSNTRDSSDHRNEHPIARHSRPRGRLQCRPTPDPPAAESGWTSPHHQSVAA